MLYEVITALYFDKRLLLLHAILINAVYVVFFLIFKQQFFAAIPAEKAFIFRITSYNVCYTKLLRMFKILNAKICRKQAEYVKQRNTTSELSESYDQPDSDNQYNMIEILQQFNLLSEKERICFSLNLVCGYTSDEISKICGMRASSVRSLLSRGRQKLKEQIISD